MRHDEGRSSYSLSVPGVTRISRALVVAHWSLAEAAITATAGEMGEGQIDLLAYGVGAQSLPDHRQGARLRLPSLHGNWSTVVRSLLGFTRAIRRHRYTAVIVAQPGIRISRARGLLLFFPFLTRSDRVLVMEPADGGLVRVGPGEAIVDLLRWLLLQVWCSVIAVFTAPLMGGIARRSSTPRRPSSVGRALYLRTDLELAGTRLDAGGSLAHTLGIVGALTHRGYEVEVWSTGSIAGLPPALPTKCLPALLRANWPMEVAELISGLRQAVFGLRARPASAFVYQRYSLNNLAGLILSRRWGVPLILEANASEVQWRQEWSILRYARLSAACERLLLRKADRVLVVSNNARDHLIKAGADPDRVRMIPNGVDPDRFANAVPRPLSFAAGSFVVAFCGLFYRWHGVGTLAEAFVRLRGEHPEARLLLIGQGEQEALVRSILDDAGVLADCLLPGIVAREEVPGYLAAADVVVSPHADLRNFIGSPIKIFEYMASGTPIVASRLAQLSEILTDEETALLVPPEDPIALASALERLMADPNLGRRLGTAAQREAQAQHSWGARLDAILSDEPRYLDHRSPSMPVTFSLAHQAGDLRAEEPLDEG
jgi:glycosyltransferase involved in cell wall biosynthesis